MLHTCFHNNASYLNFKPIISSELGQQYRVECNASIFQFDTLRLSLKVIAFCPKSRRMKSAGLTANSQLPPEPFYYSPTRTDQTLKLYGFGYPVTQADLIEIYYKVRQDVVSYTGDRILEGPLLYASGDVRLVLHPKGKMTWEMWEAVVLGILAFGTEYDNVELDFDIYLRGLKMYFGTGVLTMLQGDAVS